MRRRSLYLLVLALVLAAAGESRANSPSLAIVDLELKSERGELLLESIRKDLSIAGYEQPDTAELDRGLLGEIPAATSALVEATKQLAAAQVAYEGFELEKALASLQALSEDLQSAFADGSARRLLAKRYLLSGLVRFAQGRKSKAVNNFRLAHRLWPTLTSLDAGSHRPSVVNLYSEAVSENTNAKPARLQRDWSPKGAILYLDGRRVGAKDKIRQGPHILSLRAEGYHSQSVAISLDEKNSHSIALEELSLTESLQAQRRRVATSKGKGTGHHEKLSALAEVDILVLLRGSGKESRAALYNRDSQSLSPWVQIGSVRWQSLISLDEERAGRVALGPNTQKSDDRPWFKKWWGGGLLVGGTAIVGTALYFALSASDSSEMGVTIDQWCFGSCN